MNVPSGPYGRAVPTPPLGWGEQTYRQYLLLTLLRHTGPPALHCFLFKKGHKPLRVESVIQQVQGALLGCLGGLGHAVEIQLQGACSREGDFSVTGSRGLPGWAGTTETRCPALSLQPRAQPRVKTLKLQLPIHSVLFPLHSFPSAWAH